MTSDATATLRRYPELDGKTFLVCIGAAKCATSWLHAYLGDLPGVVVSPLKELHFFNAKFPDTALGDMEKLALSRLSFHLDQEGDPVSNLRQRPTFRASLDRARMIYDDNAYFDHFANLCRDDTRCFCDLTPAYAAIGRDGFRYLRDFCATQDCRLRILFLMRDPVDRFWSQLRHLQQMNPAGNPLENWQMALTAPPLLARADYRAVVTALDDIFPAGNLLYLFYETLFEDDNLHRLCTFCGVPFAPGATSVPRNETRLKQPLPDEARAALLHRLAPQYAFCRDRFGHAVPASWQG